MFQKESVYLIFRSKYFQDSLLASYVFILAEHMELQVLGAHPLGTLSNVISNPVFISIRFACPCLDKSVTALPACPTPNVFYPAILFSSVFVLVDLKPCFHSCNNI